MTEYLPNGRPIPKKKKTRVGDPRLGPQKVVDKPYVSPVRKVQHADYAAHQRDEAARLGVSAFPFRDKSTSKYALQSKRLVSRLGISIDGIDKHPDSAAVYTAVGQALHRLPAEAWPWLEQHGKNVRLVVSKDGEVSLGGEKAAGWYDNGGITVGVPGKIGSYQRGGFTTPNGSKVSGRSLTRDRIRDVLVHEFAHWLDDETDISKKHPELFGNVRSYDAPHDKRQWERFANSMEAYLGSSGQRETLDPNVAKFFDRFIGPTLSTDSGGIGRKGPRDAKQLKLVRRVAAMKLMHQRKLFFPFMKVFDFERLLKSTEKELEKYYGGGQ